MKKERSMLRGLERREAVKQIARLAGLGAGLVSLGGLTASGEIVPNGEQDGEFVKITKTTGHHPRTKTINPDASFTVEIKLTPNQAAAFKAETGNHIRAIRITTFAIDRLGVASWQA